MRPNPNVLARSLIALLIMVCAGSRAFATETCTWTHTGSGADLGTCVDSVGKTYCVTCQFAPRVCVRTRC